MKNILLLTISLLCIVSIDVASQNIEKDNSPIVVLCFDDAEISHYSIVAPLLQKYGYNATFFVCEMPRKTPADSVYYMNWEQIAELHKMGFEIGNHTGHHKNMTKLSREGMKEEVEYVEKKCLEYGIPKPISFAYPGNRYDSLSQVVLNELGYLYARQGGSNYYKQKEDKLLALPSFTMGSTEKLKDRTLNAFKNLPKNQVLLFTIHGVPDIAHPGYTTSEGFFEEILQYMKENQFKVIAMKDLKKTINLE
ncbi:polysaccharide deacetylase family protein [Chondrinema litorale]|uniref:polysaccharide deacetylase family protein n=1 Tax=Chondrinema litorale TaxID=2994555 RepID=UPI0025439078|nr:polysaccharide deacetylase family protein [Chondrinema litorale]UZR99086.1 polysaccharide deacetylase family protein [Chondrinema litorale]